MSGLRPATVVGLRLGTPIVGTFVLPFAAYYALLSYRVSAARIEHDTYIETSTGKGSEDGPDPLSVAVRAHGNYAENVPFALILAAIAETNGGDTRFIAGALGAFLTFRIAHVELGLRQAKAIGQGRLAGYIGTLTYLVGMSAYSVYLCKGYWGY